MCIRDRFKITLILVLVAEISKLNLQQGSLKYQTKKFIEFERCAQLGKTLVNAEFVLIGQTQKNSCPSLAPYSNGFIEVYSNDDSLQKVIIDENSQIVENSNTILYQSDSYSCFNPSIAQLKDGSYIVCFDHYVNGHYVSCILVDSSGKMIEDSYILDILNGQYSITNFGYPKAYGFSNGKYGVFITIDGNGNYAVIGSSFKRKVVQLNSVPGSSVTGISVVEYTRYNQQYVAAVFQGYITEAQYQIGLSRFTLEGLQGYSESHVIASVEKQHVYSPSLGKLKNSSLIIAFRDQTGVLMYRICENHVTTLTAGQRCGSIISLTELGAKIYLLSLSIMLNGQVFISYSQFYIGSDVYIYYIHNVLIDPTTDTVVDTWNINKDETNRQYYYYSTSAIASNGNVGIIWEDTTEKKYYGIVYKYIDLSDKPDNDLDDNFIVCVVLIPCGFILLSLIIYLICLRGKMPSNVAKQQSKKRIQDKDKELDKENPQDKNKNKDKKTNL
eukprot:TRINITY_DN2813_c0_g1_i8.p1 TRINITY_DN2813_c0_g1~~TRINITY_DN2813_c0_g1_i8.p1  ORF type:complete len:500 (-),score=63.30 TRINITY_DN2813_c0_g1_i8:465-1964(-)